MAIFHACGAATEAAAEGTLEHTIILSLWMPDRIVMCHRSCFQQTVIVYCQSSTLHSRFAVNAPAVVMAHLTVGISLLRAYFSICFCIDEELKIEIEIEKRNRRVLHILIFGCDSRAVCVCVVSRSGAGNAEGRCSRLNCCKHEIGLISDKWMAHAAKNIPNDSLLVWPSHTTHEPISIEFNGERAHSTTSARPARCKSHSGIA